VEVDVLVYSAVPFLDSECSDFASLMGRWYAVTNGTGCDTYQSSAVRAPLDPLPAPASKKRKPAQPREAAEPAAVESIEEDKAAPAADGDWEMDARRPPAVPDSTRKAKSRHWAITFPCNKRDIDEVVLFFDHWGTHRTVINMEASSNGWEHFQCYVHFKAAVSFDSLKLRLMEAQTGLPIWLQPFTEKDPGLPKYINYCRKKVDKKGGRILDHRDTKPAGKDAPERRQGKRTDIALFRDQAVSRPLDLITEPEEIIAPMCKYPRFTSECQAVYFQQQPRVRMFAICFWGPTSTGKTFRAYEFFKQVGLQPSQVYEKSPGDKWWDGYRPVHHKAVLVDEFRHVDSELNSMWLRLLDGKGIAMQTQTKGGSTFVNPEYVVFTSPFHPVGWISNGGLHGAQDAGDQYARRFKKIVNCTRKYEPEDDTLDHDAAFAALETILSAHPAE